MRNLRVRSPRVRRVVRQARGGRRPPRRQPSGCAAPAPAHRASRRRRVGSRRCRLPMPRGSGRGRADAGRPRSRPGSGCRSKRPRRRAQEPPRGRVHRRCRRRQRPGPGATASTTAGTSASVDAVPRTWPPASQPCATMMSAPSATACRASSTLPTVTISRAPASCTRPASGAGSPQKIETIGMRSDSIASIWAVTSKARTTLPTNGRSVAWRTCLIRARVSVPSKALSPSVPSPPARQTALASAGPSRAADGGLDDREVNPEPLAEGRPHRSPPSRRA